MTSESTQQHKAIAAARGAVAIAIVTVSDTRTEQTDTTAQYLRAQIAAAGHTSTGYRIIKDEPDQVAAALDEMAAGGRA